MHVFVLKNPNEWPPSTESKRITQTYHFNMFLFSEAALASMSLHTPTKRKQTKAQKETSSTKVFQLSRDYWPFNLFYVLLCYKSATCWRDHAECRNGGHMGQWRQSIRHRNWPRHQSEWCKVRSKILNFSGNRRYFYLLLI